MPKQVQILGETIPWNLPIEEELRAGLGAEAYEIRIEANRICLTGGSPSGLFYARTTLEQLRLLHPEGAPQLQIRDWPDYTYRSFHIDCVRHFIEIDELKKMIRMAAQFKLNHFHWHLTDDQGWRIECRRYPKLHEIGAVRRGDHFGSYHAEDVENRYYTREQIQEIVSFCESHAIEVVPEIELPGHVTALLAAYPQFSCTGRPLEVGTKEGVYPDILCAGKEEVFSFVEDLLDDILELFPGTYFHIGGDEAPKERWDACPLCQQRMKEEGLQNGRQLQGYLENRIARYLLGKGKQPIVWNEAAYGGNLDPAITIQVWTVDPEGRTCEHLRRGGKAILSKVENCYCDYPYGIVSLRDVYQQDLEVEDQQNVCQTGARNAGLEENHILGTECLIWTEFVRDAKYLETHCWPRFAALAETAWCGSARPGYEDFCRRLTALYPIFEKYGIEAVPQEGWLPSKEEAIRQKQEFIAMSHFELDNPE
jgi:hexosaminidase